MRRASISVLAAVAGLSSLLACGDATTAPPSGGDGGAIEAGAPSAEVTVHAVFDLPRGADTEALSGAAFEPATRTLYALRDNAPRIVPLIASESFDAFTVGAPIALTGHTAQTWDGEGLVLAGDAFIAVTSETTPTVERFDRTGQRVDAVSIPARFASQASNNKGLESLAITPSGRWLVTANESALVSDGAPATPTKGTTVRILRRDTASGVDEEYAYRTDPRAPGGGGDMGVSEIAAVTDDVLLVLERGYQSGFGNTVKIYEVDLSGGSAARVEDVPALSETTPVLDKRLVVDVGALPPGSASHPATQPNPLLDNYEALALGPAQPDGRRLVFLLSDDNASRTQVARVLVLAVPGL
ncbi:MAG: esterase-like activity of phytase family protein [Labilithrix sp.]|nr:esterase-like activity of phytase family protein [Labilithrix sp.]